VSPEPSGERLQKVLARAGFGSRRASEELIESGRVLVNGRPAHLGQRVDLAHDRVVVDDVPVGVLPGLVHYLLNKPVGVVSTANDPEGRPTVLSLVPPEPRVFSVGRLDLMSEGLLIVTNDGELAQLLTHPSHGVDKEYLVELDAHPSPAALRDLRRGVELAPGVVSARAKVSVVADRVIRIVIHEGRYHQVRRMCEAVGYQVRRLVRTRIGPVSDTRLSPGTWRNLEANEIRELSLAASNKTGSRAARRAR
jgi:23S rRNA pseudouridine2605 synthase